MAVAQNQTSTLISSTNCSYALNGDEGCIVVDPSTTSYGAGFASVGGGAFVTEMASTGIRYDSSFGLCSTWSTNTLRISIWFFEVSLFMRMIG